MASPDVVYEMGSGDLVIAAIALVIVGTFFAMGINATMRNEEDDDFLR